MRQIFFNKNWTNTETHSLAIYAFRILVKEIIILYWYTTFIGNSTLQTLISSYHKYWLPDLKCIYYVYNVYVIKYIQRI